MNPITHGLIGWSTAHLALGLSRRDVAFIVAAALAPDIDGLGLVAEVTTRGSERPLLWWSEYHHTFGHNLLFAVALSAAAWLVTRKAMVALLVFLNVHLHLLGDLVGARGPDGAQWPIPYLWPFWESLQLTVSWQWALNAWPNLLISLLLLAHLFWLAWARGVSPLGFISTRADRAFIKALRNRFPSSSD
jgi:inner membrane protein